MWGPIAISVVVALMSGWPALLVNVHAWADIVRVRDIARGRGWRWSERADFGARRLSGHVAAVNPAWV